eukprot:6193172-Pleurochrysis_carterae.AAC.1
MHTLRVIEEEAELERKYWAKRGSKTDSRRREMLRRADAGGEGLGVACSTTAVRSSRPGSTTTLNNSPVSKWCVLSRRESRYSEMRTGGATAMQSGKRSRSLRTGDRKVVPSDSRSIRA